MATVFLNGRFLSRDEALVSAFDAGFQHGVGLFETMTAVVGSAGGSAAASLGGAAQDREVEALQRVRVVHLREHLLRLANSAKELGLSDSLRVPALEEAVERTVARASLEMPDQQRFRVRLTLTGGDLNLLGRPGASVQRTHDSAGHQPTLLIVAQPATQYPREMFERGVAVTIADTRVNPLDVFEGHKALHYWPRLRALQIAAGKGAAESLLLQVTNHVVGGCVSSIVLVRDGVLLAPLARDEVDAPSKGQSPDAAIASAMGEDEAVTIGGKLDAHEHGARLPSPVLPGITRRWALEWAEDAAIEVRKRLLTIHDVLDADEVLLLNSSWGVLPVVRVEREAIGDAVPGRVGKELCAAWQTLLDGESAGG